MRRRCAAVLAAAQLLCMPAGGAAADSVLLVSIDSLRADRTSLHGNARRTTPRLDRLAAEGVAFMRAYSPTSWTLPAHVTLLTGRHQTHHRVVTHADRIDTELDLLADVFRRHGYETAGFYSGPFLDPAYGFARGFRHYESCEAEPARDATSPAAWEASHADRTGERVVRAVDGWLNARPPGPFFAFVHLWDVHYDYVPPEPFASLYDDGYDGPLDGRNIATDGFPLDAAPRDVAHLLALYDAEIRWTDAVLARILGSFERRGLLADTLVVVTADHGEEFLDHGGKGHQHGLHGELVHVPLVFWAPSGLPKGRRISTPVSLVDVAPTILSLVRIPGLPAANGRSLTDLMHGRVPWTRPAYGARYDPTTGRLLEVVLYARGHKLVGDVGHGAVRAFELDRDPEERQPRPADDPALLRALERWRTLAALPPRPPAAHPTPAQLPPSKVDRLRALGYLDSE